MVNPFLALFRCGLAYSSLKRCFFINLPIGFIAGALVFFFLRVNPRPKKPFRQHVQEFDFIGLFCIMVGVALIILGFNQGEKSWKKPLTIASLAIGGALLLLGCINE
jgi:hypothetical protein